MRENAADGDGWTFLTAHTQVLLCLVSQPGVELGDLARKVGITEIEARRTLSDLSEASYVEKERVDGHDGYRVNRAVEMRHDLQRQREVSELLDLFQLEA